MANEWSLTWGLFAHLIAVPCRSLLKCSMSEYDILAWKGPANFALGPLSAMDIYLPKGLILKRLGDQRLARLLPLTGHPGSLFQTAFSPPSSREVLMCEVSPD